MNRKAVTCPVETTLAVIHGRWKVLVIRQLLDGIKRFGELHRALPGISHRTLAKQLREMEAARLIRRKVYREVPPKVEYSLTPLGESLKPVLMAMDEWGQLYARKVTKARDSMRNVRRQRIAAEPASSKSSDKR
jgi:DNA-binding HxlR family transcriptional regulator